MKLGRRYSFRASHKVLGLPEPWCRLHAHDYTFDVVFEGEEYGIRMLDHEALDDKAEALIDQIGGENLNDHFDYTTVEALAVEFRNYFESVGFEGAEITVCEDGNRWATA